CCLTLLSTFFFCNSTSPTELYTLSLHDALPIYKLVAAMKSDPRKVLLGKERMEKLNMRVGDKFKLYSMNYKGIDLEFEIAGELPGTRWNLLGIMNDQYFNRALDTWYSNPNNKNKEAVHPLNERRLDRK